MQPWGLRALTENVLSEFSRSPFFESPCLTARLHPGKRIAWRIQALAEGDLSERARRRAEELANDADLRTRAPRDPVASGSSEVKARTATGRISPSRDPRLPLPGTLLAREFQGRDIVVKVLDNGFEFDGRRYKSLSAIAQEVTGSKWNGFLFFGIADAAAKGGSRKPERRNE